MGRVAQQLRKNGWKGAEEGIDTGAMNLAAKSTGVRARCHRVLSQVLARDERLAVRITGRQGKQTKPGKPPKLTPLLRKLTIATLPERSANYRPRHRRRPSTIPEERPESLQRALEHAADHLVEEAVGSAMDRVRSRRDNSDGRADEGPDEDAQARRRRRRSRTDF